MSSVNPSRSDLPVPDDDLDLTFDIIMQHGFQDNATWVSYNFYGDRFAAGSVDGKIRVFNRHADATWRLCDAWTAHGGEVLEVSWLPPTIYPNLLASLGADGRFKLWAEDPGAAPGRRFSGGSKSAGGIGAGTAMPAYEHRNVGAAPQAYRSFDVKHDEETRHTYLALLSADGMLTVLENEAPENLQEWIDVDRFRVCGKPARGEEQAFRVRFDPNPEVCYNALGAGVPADSLGLVVAAMGSCKVYRTRDNDAVFGTQYHQQQPVGHSPDMMGGGGGRAMGGGLSLAPLSSGREFYIALELPGHRGLVRDVAWAGGNIRGCDIIASACSDGFLRVWRINTPFSLNDRRTWSESDIVYHRGDRNARGGASTSHEGGSGSGSVGGGSGGNVMLSGIGAGLARPASGQDHSNTTPTHPAAAAVPVSVPAAGATGGGASGQQHHHQHQQHQQGIIHHTFQEVGKHDNDRVPLWRVGFSFDGQILGSSGDDGKLRLYRAKPDGTWALYSELGVDRARMAEP